MAKHLGLADSILIAVIVLIDVLNDLSLTRLIKGCINERGIIWGGEMDKVPGTEVITVFGVCEAVVLGVMVFCLFPLGSLLYERGGCIFSQWVLSLLCSWSRALMAWAHGSSDLRQAGLIGNRVRLQPTTSAVMESCKLWFRTFWWHEQSCHEVPA